jgi:hypothetical protein
MDMCRVDSPIFKWSPHFFIKIIVLAACLQKTGGFARKWPLARKICFRVALSSIVPAHFPNQIFKGRQLKGEKHGQEYNYDVKMAFDTPLVCLSLVLYPSGRQSHANFACAGGQLRAKPPVFCKHAARTII